MKIEQILGSQDITTGDGKTLKKTQFLSAGQIYFTFSDIKVGDDREEESRKPFTKQDGTIETTIKFKKKGDFKGGFKSDPNTMLVSYAKDMVVAFVSAGIIKDLKIAGEQVLNYTQVFKTAYDRLTENKPVVKKVEPPTPTDNEVDINEVNYPEEE